MSVIDTLRRARAEIVRRGWGQGSAMAHSRFSDGRTCASAAIMCVNAPVSEQSDAGLALRRALWARGEETPITAWNDAEGRTVEEVLALYDEAIAACR